MYIYRTAGKFVGVVAARIPPVSLLTSPFLKMFRKVNVLNPVTKSVTGSGSVELAQIRKVAKTNTSEIRSALTFVFTCKKEKDTGFWYEL